MFISFLLSLTASDMIPSEMNKTGELCGEVMCYTWCEKSYITDDNYTYQCFSATEELFCRIEPVHYGILICIGICIIPTLIVTIKALREERIVKKPEVPQNLKKFLCSFMIVFFHQIPFPYLIEFPSS